MCTGIKVGETSQNKKNAQLEKCVVIYFDAKERERQIEKFNYS